MKPRGKQVSNDNKFSRKMRQKQTDYNDDQQQQDPKIIKPTGSSAIQFEGRITKSSNRLRVIYCPSKLHQEIDKRFSNRKVIVTIS